MFGVGEFNNARLAFQYVVQCQGGKLADGTLCGIVSMILDIVKGVYTDVADHHSRRVNLQLA